MLRLFASDERVAKADLLETISSLLAWLLRFHPSFCLGRGLLHVLNFQIVMDLEDDDNASTSAFSPPILLIELLFLLFQSIFYFLGAVLLDDMLTS
jgi:hypothetical protein